MFQLKQENRYFCYIIHVPCSPELLSIFLRMQFDNQLVFFGMLSTSQCEFGSPPFGLSQIVIEMRMDESPNNEGPPNENGGNVHGAIGANVGKVNGELGYVMYVQYSILETIGVEE